MQQGEPSTSSLLDILRRRAAEEADERAYVFLSERGDEEAVLDFAGLERRAHGVAGELLARGAQRGDRALLAFPSGLEFIAAFFGCLVAGVLPVPVIAPRRAAARDPSAGILADCGARFVMTTAKIVSTRPGFAIRLAAGKAAVVLVDAAANEQPRLGQPVSVTPDEIAFLQYTSGSTSEPKGVMVSHGNLLANLEMIRLSFGNSRHSSCVGWLPHYHDMGLVLQILLPLYLGSLSIIMAPSTFLQRPLSWLRAIHRYRAEVSYAPNFAFDACCARFNAEQMQGVDLSSWKLALNAAEPIRAETLNRFASTFAPYGFDSVTMYPGYGMAEATLAISCSTRGAGPTTRAVSRRALHSHGVSPPKDAQDRQEIVGCGRTLQGAEIAIVEPEERRRLGYDQVGEIWVRGAHIARGYWRKAHATGIAFEAVIVGEQGQWLRTGDLGFLEASGELYVTGRIKDVIIIRGVNQYPQDIEYTAESSHPSLRRSGAAAFAVTEPQGAQRVIVVQEVERTHRAQFNSRELKETIREAVAVEHDVAVHTVVLIRPGTLPKTTSGKVQRDLTRRLWEQGTLEVLDDPR